MNKYDNNYKDLIKCFYKDNKINFVLSIITMLLLGILNIGTAFIFKGLTDIAMGGTKRDLKNMILISLLFIVTYIVFTMLRRFFYSNLLQKLCIHIREKFLKKYYLKI